MRDSFGVAEDPVLRAAIDEAWERETRDRRRELEARAHAELRERHFATGGTPDRTVDAYRLPTGNILLLFGGDRAKLYDIDRNAIRGVDPWLIAQGQLPRPVTSPSQLPDPVRWYLTNRGIKIRY